MNRKGFTLLELIVVLIVLAALVAIALPQYTSFVEKARAAEAINALGTIKTAEEAARLGNTNYNGVNSHADLENNLAVNLSSALWNYTVTASGSTSFTATSRRSNGTNSNNTVVMTYYNNGQTNWSGTHPGAPKQ